MSLKIRRAAVLGSGVMGVQIAAHLAAAGVRTYLLDLPSDEAPTDPKLKKLIGKNFRSTRSILAVEALKSMRPSPLSSTSVLPNIIPGNFEDDWSVLADADWVIEAVIERLDIKKSIHKKIAEVVRPGVPVTTNTSGISLKDICSGLPDHYQQSFFGTHFFNPPRYMHLLEVIGHGASDENLVRGLSQWCSSRLGKGIVVASDTINFIANRIGVLSIQATLKHQAELGLNIETIDALSGPLIGHPKSATFRTMDVVGLDTFAHVAGNVFNSVKDDPYHSYFEMPEWIKKLIDRGHLGQKSKSIGCYKKSKDDKGKTAILAYRPKSDEYVPQEPASFPWAKEAMKIRSLPERLKFIFSQKDEGAEFLWRIHRDIFSYSALLLEEIAHGLPQSLDEAMRWGFNWEAGPFEAWQGIGNDFIYDKLKSEGTKLPSWIDAKTEFYQPSPASPEWKLSGAQQQLHVGKKEHVPVPRHSFQFNLPNAENKNDKRVIVSNSEASLIDMGDGVGCLTFHSKMNTISEQTIELSQAAIAAVSQNLDGLVIGNEGDAFSAGANLKNFVSFIEAGNFDGIDSMLRAFQGTMQLIKYAPFPTVTAPHGLTLGGGCEVSLHGSKVLLTNDTFAGLVEVGVGLLPAGGGCKELALRAYAMQDLGERADVSTFIQRAFMLVGMAQVSSSGLDAIEKGLYPQTSEVSLSRDHQLIRAKMLVRQMIDLGYAPPVPKTAVKVLGDPGIQTIKLMLYNMVEGRQVSPYDAFVGEKVAEILCGGAVDGGSLVSEQYLLDLERKNFVELCQQEKTQQRIMHMLKTGKPLRN